MTTEQTSTNEAAGLGESALQRPVRAPHPERAAFEAWCCKRWAGDRNALTLRDDGEYLNGHVQFAWCAWQAARPKRDKVGAIVSVAAALAQRKPLQAFGEFGDATHIGHRQFGRAYHRADEDTRLLAVKLADAVQAL